MKPLKHQEKFIKGYKDKAFLVHEGGTGKTICACLWLKDGRDSNALVICPKRIIEKWKTALTDWGTKAKVISKENFKKEPITEWSAIVVDEADEFASPLFTKNRSKLSEALYNQVRTYDAPIALLTATPVRSNPWNLHTLLCYLGKYIDKKKWQEGFFNLERRPYLPRPAWIPKPIWRKGARIVLEKYADIVLLKDCVGDLPPFTETIVKTPILPFIRQSEWESSKAFAEEHKNEQKAKVKTILDIGKNYRKVLVVAYYIEQVEALKKELSKDRLTFMVHGSVKNQEQILREANECDECFLIIQASLGAGFDADTFSCVVFASMSYKARDWVQMKFRVRRIHNLHPVKYIYLLSGRCDNAVYKTIMLGKDFLPSEWSNETTRPTKKIK